eukprot:3322661-Rhodomonas_salina.1
MRRQFEQRRAEPLEGGGQTYEEGQERGAWALLMSLNRRGKAQGGCARRQGWQRAKRRRPER